MSSLTWNRVLFTLLPVLFLLVLFGLAKYFERRGPFLKPGRSRALLGVIWLFFCAMIAVVLQGTD
jgi:hypothetical protein